MGFDVNLNAAREYRRSGKKNEALEAILKALEEVPKHYACWFEYAMILEDHGKFEEADTAYTKALEYFPPDDSIEGPNAEKYMRDMKGSIYFNRGITRIWELKREQEGKNDWLEAIKLGHAEAKANYDKYYYGRE